MTAERFSAVEARAAYHEAGHAVAAVYYRCGRLSRVVLPRPVQGEPYYGASTHYRPGAAPRRFRQKRNTDAYVYNSRPIEQHILVCLAGGVAERRFSRKQGFKPLTDSDSDDRMDIEGFVVHLPAKGRVKTLSRLEREIKALFDQTSVWTATRAIGERLLRDRTIDGPFARTLIKCYLGRGLSRKEHATLRDLYEK